MNIFRLLNNDIEGLSEEERVFAESFNESLRNNIIDALVKHDIEEIIKQLKDDEDSFRERLADIFINGKKGYNKMPTKTLIDIFLHKKDGGEFINFIESISNL